MSTPAISQYVPDPFSQSTTQIVPLSNITHISKENVNTIGYTETGDVQSITLGAGAYLSPIVFWNEPTGDTQDPITLFLPTPQALIGAFGGTSPNSAITVGGRSFNTMRPGNSNNQVQVGDVFVVPIYNLLTLDTAYAARTLTISRVGVTGVSIGKSGAEVIVIPGYDGTDPGTFAPYFLTIFISELPSATNPTGSYIVY